MCPTGHVVTVCIRWYAAAADAAGTAEETVEAGDLAAVLAAARERHGERLAQVLGVCSVLVDGQRTDPAASVPLADGAVVDVLPPFAGG